MAASLLPTATAGRLAMLRLQLFTAAQTLTGTDFAALQKLVAEVFVTLELDRLTHDQLMALVVEGDG